MWATVKSPMMDVAESGFGPKSVNILMVMGKVLYVIAESGLGLESVKVTAEREAATRYYRKRLWAEIGKVG